MNATVRRFVGAVSAAAAIALATACGAEQPAPSESVQAQSGLRPPISAQTDDPSAPSALTVAGRTAPTRAVATDVEGTLLPPQKVAELGWWVDSALPGSGRGTVVVTGHVDDVEQGEGFAAAFAGMKAGDEVTVAKAGGGEVRYRVSRAVGAQKDGKGAEPVPFDELNRLDGPEQLALVTCGGPFVGPPLGYRDNIVVFADPV